MLLLNSIQERLRKFDWILLAAVVLLMVLGLAAIYSVGLSHDQPDFTNFKKQLAFAGLGLLALFSVSLINYSAFRVYSRVFYVFVLILLVAVLFWGQTIRGTKGWFDVFGLGFQPVELAKVAVIIFLARFFANRFQLFNQAKHIIVSISGVIILAGLVLLQPDAGSAFVLFGIWFGLLLLTGIKWRYVLIMAVILAVVLSCAWLFLFQDYQKNRVLTFLNPELDPLGSGYNVTQAMIAIGSGQLLGRGLGFGSQSQLKFIPESQTDFVFAVIAEELGLAGVLLLLGLWLVIFSRLIRAAQKAPDDFGMFLLLGVSLLFFIHLIINVGMNLGLMPVTGISLPFLSYGGSFLLISLALIGLAQSVIVRS